MVTAFREIKNIVNRVVNKAIIQDMIEVVKEIRKNQQFYFNLQGNEKGRSSFIEEYIYLLLYKFIQNIGYQKLWNQVSKKKNGKKVGWIPEAHNTFQENIQRLTEHLRTWSSKYIRIGKIEEWKAAAKTAGLPIKLKDGILLLDSTDIFLCKSKTPPSEDEWFSGKECIELLVTQEYKTFKEEYYFYLLHIPQRFMMDIGFKY